MGPKTPILVIKDPILGFRVYVVTGHRGEACQGKDRRLHVWALGLCHEARSMRELEAAEVL